MSIDERRMSESLSEAQALQPLRAGGRALSFYESIKIHDQINETKLSVSQTFVMEEGPYEKRKKAVSPMFNLGSGV